MKTQSVSRRSNVVGLSLSTVDPCPVSALAREMAELVMNFNSADEQGIEVTKKIEQGSISETELNFANRNKKRIEKKQEMLEYLMNGVAARVFGLQASEALGALFQLSIVSQEISGLGGVENARTKVMAELMLYSVAEFIRKAFALAGPELVGCEYYMPDRLNPHKLIDEAA